MGVFQCGHLVGSYRFFEGRELCIQSVRIGCSFNACHGRLPPSLTYSRKQIFFSFVTMSAPSTTASQTDFCDALSRDNVTPEPQSSCDEPIPINKLIAT